MADSRFQNKRTHTTRVASPYGHGVDVVQRVTDPLDVMTKRRQLTQRQYHAGIRYRHCYDVIYGQLGGSMDFDRPRGGGGQGTPPPVAYMEASETISLVKRVLYPKDYAIVHRVCAEGLSIQECARTLYGGSGRAETEQAGRRLQEGLRELADRWYPEERVVRVKSFRTEKPTATNATTVERGRVHVADT